MSKPISTYPFPLENHYQIVKEVCAGWRIEVPNKIANCSLVVTHQALFLAIIYRIEAVIDFAINHSRRLSQNFGKRNFTFLHIAIISENHSAALKLLRAKVCVDARDIYGWTPLHHAAILSNNQGVLLLLQHDANPNIKTPKGADYKKIWQLSHFPAIEQSEKIRLLFENDQGQKLVTHEEFHALTQATFIHEHILSQEQILVEWQTPRIENIYPFCDEFLIKYSGFKQNPPLHLLKNVKRDSQNRPLALSIGKGLFAFSVFQKYEIIGEYLGQISRKNSNSAYKFEHVDSLLYKNEIPFINDGFPNLIVIPLLNFEGVSIRFIFITTEKIVRGTQFCWNYGMQTTKFFPYQEIRGKEVREFIQKENLDALIALIKLGLESHELSLEDFIRFEQFRYILETPHVLFLLVVEGFLNQTQIMKIFTNVPNSFFEGNEEYFHHFIDKAFDCKKVIDGLSQNENFKQVYLDYIKKILSDDGMLMIFKLIGNTNSYLKLQIKQIKQKQIKNSDEFLLYFWQTQVLPNNEKEATTFRKEICSKGEEHIKKEELKTKI